MQRYFARNIDKHIFLNEDDVFHLLKVMRARKGEQIEAVCDGRLFLAELVSTKPLEICIVNEIKENNELSNEVILICALLKGDKLDYVVQKATELGVSEIVFALTKRTIVKVKRNDKDFRFDRYRRIAKEASEQSKRLRVPLMNKLINLDRINEVKADIKLVAYESVSGSTKSFIDNLSKIKADQKIAIFIGPEGGFDASEITYLEAYGYKCVSLGRRILRAETASINAISVISNYLERN